MRHQRQELTLTNALSDPLVRTVMAADGVDPRKLSAMLREIGSTLDRRSRYQLQRGGSLSATNCA
jgi:hypothetical protein